MTPRAKWIALGVAIALPLAAALGWWWFDTHELVEEEVELPQVGEVTYNPLYVLGLSLREAGWTVEMRQRLDSDAVALGPRDTVIVLNDPRRLSDADTDSLLAFVEGGGHLVVRTPPLEAFSPEAEAGLLQALGVRMGHRAGCVPMQVEGEDGHIEFCQGQRFDVVSPQVPILQWRVPADRGGIAGDTDPATDDPAPAPAPAATPDTSDDIVRSSDGPNDARERSPRKPMGKGSARQSRDGDDGNRGIPIDVELPRRQAADDPDRPDRGRYAYARLQHGEGSVDVIADLDFLTNDELREPPHVTLTRQLLAPNHQAGTVHLLYAAEMPSLWRWLFEHSWMAWLPMLLALLAWLWSRMQRFGPLLPSPPAERRSLLEHVRASGELAWRYGYAHVLHDAVRAAFMTRLRRRDPQAAALEGEAQAALIAERFHITPAEVREALATPPVRDPAAFRSRIATLIRLRNQL